jgi:(p)ppGpp synthase/HD superfamily hydrolase
MNDRPESSMATLERAIELAAHHHTGQVDKEGKPYILHPLRVMMACTSVNAKIVAVLHDTLEDTKLTEADLRREGFSAEVIEAVLAVTHRSDESYADYVIRASRLELAREVKLADLADNTHLDRVIFNPATSDRDLKRMHRYLLAYKFLTGQHNEAEYRSLMSGV